MGPRAEIVLTHHERTVVRIDDAYVKVDVVGARLRRERHALDVVTVPAPRVLWFVDGPPTALAMSAVPGRPLASHGAPPTFGAVTWRAAGAMARRIHATTPPSGLRHWLGDGSLALWIENEARWLVDDGRADRAAVDRRAAHAHSILDDHVAAADVFTHGDLQCEHVLVDDDGTITGVIDWGDVAMGDPLYDLAVLSAGNADHLDDVIVGYGADVDRDVVRAYWSLRRLGGTHWMLDHGFDASGDLAALALDPYA